jgi:aspartate aminotransferase
MSAHEKASTGMAVSATLAADEQMRRRSAAGLRTVPLAFGQAGVPVHPRLREAIAHAADRNDYGSVAGSAELREAAAGYWQRRGLDTDPDQVVAGPGSKALLYSVLRAVGGDVVVPRPSWVTYAAQISLLGARPLHVPTPPGEGGVPDADALVTSVLEARRGGRDVRAVVLTLPDNPTGTMASVATIERACMAARDLDLVVISDEIYRDLLYRGPFHSPAEYAPERVVITSGLSKSLSLGGWRLGITRLPHGEIGDRLRERVLSTASEIWSSVAQPVQHAAADALGEPPELVDYVARARRLYESITLSVADAFTAAGARVTTPQAAFYAYPDLAPHRSRLAADHRVHNGSELAALLLDRYGIATLPGHVFGEPTDWLTLRICTGMLTGNTSQEQDLALNSAEPLSLAWIADPLNRLQTALAELLR